MEVKRLVVFVVVLCKTDIYNPGVAADHDNVRLCMEAGYKRERTNLASF